MIWGGVIVLMADGMDLGWKGRPTLACNGSKVSGGGWAQMMEVLGVRKKKG